VHGCAHRVDDERNRQLERRQVAATAAMMLDDASIPVLAALDPDIGHHGFRSGR